MHKQARAATRPGRQAEVLGGPVKHGLFHVPARSCTLGHDRAFSGRRGSRTLTSLTGQRILSPLRLPFRHPAFVRCFTVFSLLFRVLCVGLSSPDLTPVSCSRQSCQPQPANSPASRTPLRPRWQRTRCHDPSNDGRNNFPDSGHRAADQRETQLTAGFRRNREVISATAATVYPNGSCAESQQQAGTSNNPNKLFR